MSIFTNEGNIGRGKLRNIKIEATAPRSAIIVISLAFKYTAFAFCSNVFI